MQNKSVTCVMNLMYIPWIFALTQILRRLAAVPLWAWHSPGERKVGIVVMWAENERWASNTAKHREGPHKGEKVSCGGAGTCEQVSILKGDSCFEQNVHKGAAVREYAALRTEQNHLKKKLIKHSHRVFGSSSTFILPSQWSISMLGIHTVRWEVGGSCRRPKRSKLYPVVNRT